MAPSYTLTALDMTGIQPYIFGSNRMRENVGASALVEQAIQLWPLEILAKTMRLKSNITKVAELDGELSPDLWIERDGLAAEVLLRGGGNVQILFASREDAHTFANHYSRRLLTEAPGLQAAIAHVPVVWDQPEQSLRDALRALGNILAQQKATRIYSTPLLGLGVTVDCESSGLPANGFDPFYLQKVKREEQRYRAVSAAILAKVDQVHQNQSRDRLEELIPAFKENDIEFWYNPEQDDEPGEDDEGRYLAVVHADGNSMGARFQEILNHNNHHAPTDDRTAIQQMRLLSKLVNEAGQRALTMVGDAIVKAWHRDETNQKKKLAKRLAVKYLKGDRVSDDSDGKPILPFRPLVYGGDDVTFVCDGRLGLSLATIYLYAFESATAEIFSRQEYADLRAILPEDKQSFHACAGIAICKLHYPFARAYHLADSLCKRAKHYVKRDWKQGEEGQASALDWHITQTGIFGDIGEIREREYEVADGALSMRPLLLNRHPNEWRTWPQFRNVLTEFLDERGEWFGRYNKIIQLREALRQGPDAVAAYRTAYRLPPLPLFDQSEAQIQTHGWAGSGDHARCSYFDVIEAMTFFIDLA